jgi:hypothetical protein
MTVQRKGAPSAADGAAQLDAEGKLIEIDSGNELAELEQTKVLADAYGVAVRAGAITPAEQDEEFIRGKMGLPSIPPAVRTAWKKDEGTRRPITIQPPPGTEPASGAQPPPAAAPEE